MPCPPTVVGVSHVDGIQLTAGHALARHRVRVYQQHPSQARLDDDMHAIVGVLVRLHGSDGSDGIQDRRQRTLGPGLVLSCCLHPSTEYFSCRAPRALPMHITAAQCELA
jgi:hypothetical protein